jgi:Chaperone of endosialidase
MRLRYFESSPSIAMGPTPHVSTNSNTQKERTMHRLSIAFALSTLLLVTICSAQQTAQNTPANPAQHEPPIVIPYIYGGGTTNYIVMFHGLSGDGHYQVTQSGVAQMPCVSFPATCVVSPNAIDLEDGGAPYGYLIYGNTVLAIGNAGDQNVFLGTGAGASDVPGSGVSNTFLGHFAGNGNTNGSYSTYVGDRTGLNTIGSYNTYVGYQAGVDQPAESNTMRLGAHDQTNYTYIAGILNTTLSSGVPVLISNGGQLGTMTSSLRFKEQVRDMGDSTNDLMKLRPVTFFYKPEYENEQHTLQYGLIAEEVAKVYPELVADDKDGKPYTVRYQYIATMLLNEVQKQYHRAEAQADLIKAQEQEIDGLKQQLQVQSATLQERLSRLEALARVERAATH